MEKTITGHEHYKDDGSIKFISWGYEGVDGMIVNHREDGAAVQYFDENGNIAEEYWYIEGTEYAPWEIEDEIEKTGVSLPTIYI